MAGCEDTGLHQKRDYSYLQFPFVSMVAYGKGDKWLAECMFCFW